MNKRTYSSSQVSPWTLHKREILYTKDMCPKTLNILGRAVHVDISPDLTQQHREEMIHALAKVLKYYLANK